MSGIWLGKILGNDIHFAKFTKVFIHHNFTLYSKTDLEDEDTLIIRILMIGPKVSIIHTHYTGPLYLLYIKFILFIAEAN